MYLIDTNFLGTITNLYPDDVFPTLWNELENTLFTDDVFFHAEVDAELRKWGHPKLQWYLDHVQPKQILQTDEAELEEYERVTLWAEEKQDPAYKQAAVDDFLNVADSWLVASGARHGYIIVSNETPAPNAIKRIKIPDAAAAFNVECKTLLEFLRARRITV